MADELKVFHSAATAPYAIIRRKSDYDVWDGSAFGDFSAGSIANYDVTLTDNSDGSYSADFPTTISAGSYLIYYYEYATAGTPATTDDLLSWEEIYWNGSSADSSPSSDYLTTLAKVKLYLNETGTGNDSLLTNLLGAASRFIEKYIDSLVLAGSYTEYVHGKGHRHLTTKNRWINSVSRIATGRESVLTVSNTSAFTSIQRAYVSLVSGSLSLVRTASASSTTNTLALATYTTLGTLATAIEAIGNGWDATVLSGYDNFPSADLRDLQQGSAVDGDEAILDAFIDELTWSHIDSEWGEIYGGPFPKGFENIEVKYSAGYAAGSIPDDIQNACAALTAGLFKASRHGSGSLKREKAGHREYENFDPSRLSAHNLKAISLDAFLLLSPHRRVTML